MDSTPAVCDGDFIGGRSSRVTNVRFPAGEEKFLWPPVSFQCLFVSVSFQCLLLHLSVGEIAQIMEQGDMSVKDAAVDTL